MNSYTTTGTTSITIQQPTVTTTGTGLYVNPNYGWDISGNQYINHYNFALAEFMIEGHVQNIIQREMRIARRKFPEVDFDRIQDMLNSDDTEMKNLGIKTIGEYTTYLSEIFWDVIYNNGVGLGGIVERFMKQNRINISEEVL